MKSYKVNWIELKKDYRKWRSELYRITKELLTSSDRFELSKYNKEGYFHRVRNGEYFKKMHLDWKREGRVPEEWIAKGHFPGIWTAMFNPHNTYSRAHKPICLVRFYFKEGFFIYDTNNPNHKKLWDDWNGKNRENLWKKLKNYAGISLEERMKDHKLPYHKGFFEDNKFGAFIGYSDYISPVIILEDSIDNIEFLECKTFKYFHSYS